MKVLIGTISDLYKEGGAQSHIRDLSSQLRKNDIDTIVLSPGEMPKTFTVFLKVLCLAIMAGNKKKAIAKYSKLLLILKRRKISREVARLIKNRSVDIIHAHDALFASGVQFLGVPVVLTVHGPMSREMIMSLGYNESGLLEFIKEVERCAYKNSAAIMAVDTGQKDIICLEHEVDPLKVSILLNAVDTNVFKKEETDLPENSRPYFLVPRRLVKKNGVSVAIQAFNKLTDLDVSLLIAGGGPERNVLEDLAEKLNIKNRVKFLGPVSREQMVKLMSQSLGTIIPSVPADGVVEASSIAALEGMSMGRPVFASNIGGLSEMIQDGKTGFLFAAGDTEALSDLLRSVFTGSQKNTNEICENARAYVESNHSIDVWAKRIIDIYEGVLK